MDVHHGFSVIRKDSQRFYTILEDSTRFQDFKDSKKVMNYAECRSRQRAMAIQKKSSCTPGSLFRGDTSHDSVPLKIFSNVIQNGTHTSLIRNCFYHFKPSQHENKLFELWPTLDTRPKNAFQLISIYHTMYIIVYIYVYIYIISPLQQKIK